MLIDFRLAQDRIPQSNDIDFCVVGGGIAGLALVRQLMGRGKRILLLESGGADYEPDVAALNAGINQGQPYYDLEDARLRLFGGTAAIWGGRCAELDDIDFEPREWVRYSGWPFPKAALSSYYSQARQKLRLDTGALDEHLWSRLGIDPPRFGAGVLETNFWQFDDAWDRFGYAANRDLLAHPDVLSCLYATVVEVHLNPQGTAVESVEVASLNGRRSRVTAKYFVLASGGIENARILLASRSREPDGIGNRHDVVGRYFMEHPHARGGRLHLTNLWSALKAFRSSHWLDGQRYSACLRPDEKLQRDKRILNSSFTPRVRPHPSAQRDVASRLYKLLKEQVAPTRATRNVWRAARGAARWLQRGVDPLFPWLQVQSDRKGLYLSVRAEQAPNPASRVKLSEECDALGVPRVALDWRLSPIDKATVSTWVAELDSALRRDGAGRVDAAPWLSKPGVPWEHDGLVSLHAIGGYHHIGTTRMASDPRFGVVDANCRVHGIANLFVAGSSVFPTSGWANPTLTILAMSLRLADHLSGVAGRVSAIRGAPPPGVIDLSARIRGRAVAGAGSAQ